MRRNKSLIDLAALAIGCCLCYCILPSTPASAQSTIHWIDNSGGNFNDGANWSGGTVPGVGDTAVIDTIHDPFITLDTDVSLDTLNMVTADPTVQHTAGTLTLSGSIIAPNGSGFFGGGYRLLGGTIKGGAFESGHVRLFSGGLDGVTITGDLEVAPDGAAFIPLTLSNATSFTGNINVGEGSVAAFDQDFQLTPGRSVTVGGSSSFAFGAGLQIENGRTLTLDSGTTSLIRSQSSVQGNGTLINSGDLTLDNSHLKSKYIENLGSITIEGTNDFGDLTQVILGSRTSFINQAGATITIDGDVAVRYGAFTTKNLGEIIVNGNSKLQFDRWHQTADIGTITNNTGNLIEIIGSGIISNHSQVFDRTGFALKGGTISGGDLDASKLNFTGSGGRLSSVDVTGDLTLLGTQRVDFESGTTVAGTIRLRDTAQLTLNQNLTRSSGQIVVGDFPDPGGYLTIGSGRTLTLDSSGSLQAFNGIIDGDGAIVNNVRIFVGGTSEITGAGSLTNHGDIQADSDARATISRRLVNSDTGHVLAVTGAELTLNNWTNSGLIQAKDDSKIILDGNFSTADMGTLLQTGTGQIHLAGMMDNTGATFASNDYYLSGGTITGGTLTGNLNATIAGGTLDSVNVTGGLTISGAAEVDLIGSTTVTGDLDLDENVTVVVEQDLNIIDGQAVTLGTATGGQSQITVADGKNLTIDDGAIIAGNGVIFAGDAATVLLDGHIAPGFSPGELTLDGNGDFILGPNSELQIEIASINSFDQLTANNLTLGGDLQVSLIDGFTLGEGMQFDFLTTNGTQTGMFAGLQQGDTVGTFGDFNLTIDYQNGTGVSLHSASAVPEPGTLAVFSVASLGWLFQRRRRKYVSSLGNLRS